MRTPEDISVDEQGNVFIADSFNDRIRKISTAGVISTLAGNGGQNYSGDGGLAVNAQLFFPYAVAVDAIGNVYAANIGDNSVREFSPVSTASQFPVIGSVADAASESVLSVSPGKIVVIYGTALGPSQGVTARPTGGLFGTQLAGTTVSVSGIAAPVYYASATQVNAIVPYGTTGTTANITVSYQGGVSSAFAVPVAPSSPGIFTYNSTGAGQAAAINDVDGTLNTAQNPVRIGGYISFYATGAGQTTPAGVDGQLGTGTSAIPNLPVTATEGGLPATVQYRGGVYGVVAGLMQVNVLIPAGVTPGGYVPVVLTVGNQSTVNGAVWIAVSN